MIDACARVGDADKAEFWLGELVRSGSKPSPVSYGVLLSSFARLGDSARAEAWFNKMQANAQQEVGVLTYNSLINACSRSHDVAGAERWLERMIENGVEADVVSYSTL